MMYLKTVIWLAGIALAAANLSAWADAIPMDQSYLEHLPRLTNLSRFRMSDSEHDPVYSAEQPADENPFAHVGDAYGKMIGALLNLSPNERRQYWSQVGADGNAAIADTAGFLGDSIGDLTQAVNGAIAGKEGLVSDPQALQCTGALPFSGSERLGGISAITQLKHTWLQIGHQSYGMPYTLQETYFGGDALIRSPDDFQSERLQDVACVPIFQPSRETRAAFSQRLQCVAQKSSTAQLGIQTRQLILNYDAFSGNCLAAVRFITECAGGKISQIPNLDVGGAFQPDQEVKFRFKDDRVIGVYDNVFASIESLDEALGTDLAGSPTLSFSQFFSSHQELFLRLLRSVENASSLIEEDEPARIQGDYRVTVQGNVVVHHEHWLKFALETWNYYVSGKQNFRDFANYIYWFVQQASLDYPAVAYTTVSQACDQISSECSERFH